MMNGISIIETTNKYVVVKIPRQLAEKANLVRPKLTDEEALKILKIGMAEYRARKTKRLVSLRNLRYGN